jgi:hypothetical protein
MTTKKSAPASAAGDGKVIAENADSKLVLQNTADSDRPVQKAGESGPKSSLETGVGSPTGASAGGEHDFEGRRGEGATKNRSQTYSVQVHTDEDGLEVFEIDAETGDEAAQKALEKKGYRGASVRGVTPASDPDPNSLGGERDASIMIANAENGPGAYDPLGTEANRKATEELGKKDIEELGE